MAEPNVVPLRRGSVDLHNKTLPLGELHQKLPDKGKKGPRSASGQSSGGRSKQSTSSYGSHGSESRLSEERSTGSFNSGQERRMLRRQSSYGGVAMSESGTMRSSAFTAYENEAILEKPFHVRLWFYTVTRSYRWIVKNRTSVISAVEQTSALFWLFMLPYQCAFEPIVTFNALYGFNYAVDAIVLILRLGVIYSQMRAKEEKGRRRGARLRTQDRSAWGRWTGPHAGSCCGPGAAIAQTIRQRSDGSGE